MAIVTTLSGYSGSGKTYSLRNLNWDESFVLRPNRKPFTFLTKDNKKLIKRWDKEKKEGHYEYVSEYESLYAILKKLPEYGKKCIVIEDSTHILLGEVMDTALEKGFEKFMRIAMHFYQLIQVAQNLPDDVRVYLVTHLDVDENNDEIIKIVGGKFITEKIDVPSLMTISLKALKVKDKYHFLTQSTGRDFYKSPPGMFDLYIDNDLRIVDDKIKEFFVEDE
jgi:hypothetical protein